MSPRARARSVLCAPALALALAGCVTDDRVNEAINDINQHFRVEYESILAEKGTRVYRASRGETYDALVVAMQQRVVMHVGDQARDLGYVNFFAPAPKPLDAKEWAQAAQADLPQMRSIATQHVGIAGEFLSFEPEGLEVVINATVIGASDGSEVSLTARMREYAPPKSGRPRREYLPPTAVRMGLDKIWAALDAELGQTGRRR